MFQTACELLLRHQSIVPIEIVVRRLTGKPDYHIGAGILLNRDGWILTAAHILQLIVSTDEAIKKTNLHLKREEEIRNASDLPSKEKQKQLKALGKIDPKSPTNRAFRVGQQIGSNKKTEMLFFEEADLGALTIENFAIPDGYTQPYFRKEPLRIGETVCRIGYPFYSLDVRWDEKRNGFVSKREPIPPFANEGIVSRFIAEPMISKKLPIHFAETSSPGIGGQSGGPLFDTHGRICGIQSHTAHYPLGFSPRKNGQTEHQFLNIGRATQVNEIFKFLSETNIPFASQ